MGTVSSIENLTNLRTFELYRNYAWETSVFEVSSPSIQSLKINSFNTVRLGQMESLRSLEVTFPKQEPHLLTIEAIPSIDEFYVKGDYRSEYKNNNLNDSLLKASNATQVTFSSTASEIPSELTNWPHLKRVNFSRWNPLTEFPTAFREWKIPEIVCVYTQIGLNNFPEHVQTVWCVAGTTKPTRDPVGLKRLKKMTTLICISGWDVDPYLKEIFECSTLQYLDLSRCYISQLPSSIKVLSNLLSLKLQDNDKIQTLPDDIGSLTKLRYLNVKDTGIRALPQSIEHCTDLQRIELPELSNPLKHRSILGRPYIRQGQIYYGPHISSLSLETQLRAFFLYLKDHPSFGQEIEVLHIDPRAIRQPSDLDTIFTTEGLNDPHVFMYPDIDFSLLPNLKHLNICRIEGNFKQLPASIQLLHRLESIDISHNRSLNVPDWLFTLPRLKEIFAYGVLPFVQQERYLTMAKEHGVTLHVQAQSHL